MRCGNWDFLVLFPELSLVLFKGGVLVWLLRSQTKQCSCSFWFSVAPESHSMAIREVSSLEDASKYDDGATVLVIKDTFTKLRGHFLSSLEAVGSAEVAYQRNSGGVVNRLKAPLAQIQRELLPCSQHHDSILVMDENLLAGGGLLAEAPCYLKEDWFQEFPEMLRPSQTCLILGGRGSRSDLHADPLSWTGWNSLLEGSKAWRFYGEASFQKNVRPFGIKSEHVELCSIGASFVSPVDTYATGTDFERPFSLTADFARFPEMSKAPQPLEYVQKAGETLIFPGHWWHQTYHLGATVGLAGQILNHRNLRRVMGHVIDWCGLEVDERIWEKSPQEVIAQVLGEAIDSMWTAVWAELVAKTVDTELWTNLTPWTMYDEKWGCQKADCLKPTKSGSTRAQHILMLWSAWLKASEARPSPNKSDRFSFGDGHKNIVFFFQHFLALQ